MKQEYFKFKKLLIGFGFSFGAIGIIEGILAFAGLVSSFKVDDKPQHGIAGLLWAFFFAGLATITLTFFCYAFLNIGVFLCNLLNNRQEQEK